MRKFAASAHKVVASMSCICICICSSAKPNIWYSY